MRGRKSPAFLAVVLLCAVLLSGCSFAGRRVYFSSGAGLFQVFRIGDFTCGQKEAKTYLLNYKNIYGKVGNTDLFQGGFDTENMEDHLKTAALSHLSRVYALNQYAKDHHITLDHQEKTRTKEAAQAYDASLSKKEKSYLGAKEEDFEKMYERLALAEKVYANLMSAVDEEVSEDEARVMDVEMIVTSDSAKAETVANALSSGSAFEVLSQYNEGDSFTVEMKRGDYPKDVEKAAYALDDGQTSEEIASSDGKYYFVKCISKYNEELSNENKESIIEKRKNEQMNGIVDELDQNEYSELNKNLWKSISFPKEKGLDSDDFFDDLHAVLNF